MFAQSEITAQEAALSVLFPVLQNGRIGYIDNIGQLVVPPQFNVTDVNFRVLSAVTLRAFREGLAPVKIADRWGYMDATGALIIPEQFEEASAFHAGLAAVKIAGQWGAIDTSGNIIVNPQFDEMGG